ncbi:hypothetical protein Tdes44962_MAKER00772 [Teratosphaeria destructans]|uniref:Uncharacterized protein n=1 Tax=Teratosphaeria destructans TaxID=418781 RepID=A0A9W7SMJ8_9PEZI|nr:hypothetical protein Tdes44962_MAKER00772 [Teratosphaeria destructans]
MTVERTEPEFLVLQITAYDSPLLSATVVPSYFMHTAPVTALVEDLVLDTEVGFVVELDADFAEVEIGEVEEIAAAVGLVDFAADGAAFELLEIFVADDVLAVDENKEELFVVGEVELSFELNEIKLLPVESELVLMELFVDLAVELASITVEVIVVVLPEMREPAVEPSEAEPYALQQSPNPLPLQIVPLAAPQVPVEDTGNFVSSGKIEVLVEVEATERVVVPSAEAFPAAF